jgi:hypothetical protein
MVEDDYMSEQGTKKPAYYSISRHNSRKARRTVTFVSVVFFLLIVAAVIYGVFIRPNAYLLNGGEAIFKTTRTHRFSDDYVSMAVEDNYMYTCTKNGLNKHTLDGNNIWSNGYYFDNPQMVQSGDYIVVADVTGKKVKVYDKDGFIYEIDESYPVIFADVNDEGFVTVVMDKNDQNLINYYNNIGELRVSRNTRFLEDGYPVSVDSSNDVTKMVTGYLNISTNRLQTQIAFFGFEDKYDVYDENIIGAFNYDNALLNYVEWIDLSTAIAVMDTGVYIYNVSEEPTEQGFIPSTAKIKKVVHSDQALVVQYGEAQMFDGDLIENSVVLYDYDGNQLKQFQFEESIKTIVGAEDSYYIVTTSQVLKMKRERREWFASTYLVIEDFFEVSDKEFVAVTDTGYEVIELRDK